MLRCVLVPLAVGLAGASPLLAQAPAAAAAGLAATRVASGLTAPVFVAAPPGDPRLFVVELPGRILVLENGVVAPVPFLDIRDRVDTAGEGGLLGLVFAPDYAQSGTFYVYYTTAGSPLVSRVARFSALGDPASTGQANPGSEAILLSVPQPQANHNGGTIAIRGDFLYVGLGDGGGSGDPDDLAQDDASLLGKLLRLDLTQPGPPSWEVWAKGFRNPFRFSFDRETGDLYVGDVGQSRLEEIDVERSDDPGGRNYGWDSKEGTLCFDADPGEPACDDPTLVDPVFEYEHEGEQCSGSVTGGAVYRGSAIAGIEGLYFFADFCKDRIWSLRWNPATGVAEEVVERTAEIQADAGSLGSLVAIAEDGAGELHLVDIGGEIFRLVPEPGAGALGSTCAVALAAMAARRRRVRPGA